MDGGSESSVCGEVCSSGGEGDGVSMDRPKGGETSGMGVVGVEEDRGDGSPFPA